MHQVPRHSHIIETPEKVVVLFPNKTEITLPRCSKPSLRAAPKRKAVSRDVRDSPDDGWQVWTAYNNVNNATFDAFLGYFNVPQNPPNWDGGILYMFTGLQNDNWVPIPGEWPTPPGFDIIQPVLQFGGDSEDGGGDYWELASWYVTLDAGAVWSTPEQVNPGDLIFGNMTRVGPTSWYIGGHVAKTGVDSSFTVTHTRLRSQPWAYCTLEVYQIDDCNSDFPPASSAMQFTKLALFDKGGKHKVAPQWQALDNGADHCGATATVQSASAITITF